jgi:hypothetical protein
MLFVLGTAAVASLLILVASIFPGVLSELGFNALLSSPVWFPSLCIVGYLSVNLSRESSDIRGPSPLRSRGMRFGALVLLMNLALLWGDVPQRLAFWFSRPAFLPFVERTLAPRHGQTVLDRKLGLYHVDLFAADPRGGIYFRTRGRRDGFGGQVFSYGFAYKPNPMGSPFGDAKYHLAHLVGDWYGFAAMSEG